MKGKELAAQGRDFLPDEAKDKKIKGITLKVIPMILNDDNEARQKAGPVHLPAKQLHRPCRQA
ncbi:hypothetical protein C4J81_04885 [Deltaproteobacteria bacterium Smac51]|nr:hypothetical protein C4J81_04885 [Deltaproteobacteria bacterium Smac51]